MRRAAGFTIIECLISVIIILISFFVIAKAFPGTQQQAVMTKNRVEALRIARNYLDNVRSQPYGENPAALDAFRSPQGDVTLSERVEDAITTVVFKPSVTFDSGGNTADLTKAADVVAVTVKWREKATGSTGPEDTDKSITIRGGFTRVP